MIKQLSILLLALGLAACTTDHHEGSFGYDKEFLEQYQEPVCLKANKGKSMVLVSPELQGRVMTSTANGMSGNSYGWMNYELFQSGEFVEQINPFGGEDRFWIGPEGGQYSIFFKPGSEFSFENWSTPAAMDTEPFEVISHSEQEVAFQKSMKLLNYQGFEFNIDVFRTVNIFEKEVVEEDLSLSLPGDVDVVAYESDNEILNTGNEKWSMETGLLSIWILGMFNPSENTTVILPYRGDLELNTAYFGAIPPGRLKVTDSHVMFKGNGTHRFKLGVPPQNVLPLAGSYDADKGILTIVKFTFDEENTRYVNSMWEYQDEPYVGDVLNSYNDGPLENGGQLGPFFELESSSPTRELAPGESIKHLHRTYHFEGARENLDMISRKILDIGLDELEIEKVLVPVQENDFVRVYKPSGDHFFGPDTKYLEEGKWYDEWVPNDHCFVKADDGLWHIFGITHPLVLADPLKDGIHDGEYASFHAVSSAKGFKETLNEEHYKDLPKILPPSERPGEILANHAPYIVKKDGIWHMVYGHSPIRLAVSEDLMEWEPKGSLFPESDKARDEEHLFNDARDPNLLYHEGKYYIIYCSSRSVNMRESTDLINWSAPKTIFRTDTFDPESPSLIFHNNTFYLFVCSWDGIWDQKEVVGAYQHKTYVLQSDDPLDFGTDKEKMVTTLNGHAPEVFQDEDGDWYISSVEWPMRGVSVDKLKWE